MWNATEPSRKLPLPYRQFFALITESNGKDTNNGPRNEIAVGTLRHLLTIVGTKFLSFAAR